MYKIQKIHYLEDWKEVLLETTDPSVAYEAATEYHAATMGLSGDEEMNKEHSGPYAIMITDEYGESMWQECSRLRCPSNEGGLVH